jgi:hypothetical protein
MSFIKKTAPQKEDYVVSYKCCAHGCPLTGTISTVQNKWTCSYHFRAESESWPFVTMAILEGRQILGIVDGLKKLSEIEWSCEVRGTPAQRDFYKQLFDDQPDLKPYDDENKSHYEYRLMDHIAITSGVLAKKKVSTYVGTKTLSKFTTPADYLVRKPQKPFVEVDKDDYL